MEYPELDNMVLGHLLTWSSADTLEEIEEVVKKRLLMYGWHIAGALLGFTAEADTRW